MINRKTIQYSYIRSAANTSRCVVLSVLLFPSFATAQRQRNHVNLLWFGYYNTVQLNSRFAIESDLQVRTRDWARQWSQQLVRTGLRYSVSPKLTLTAGGAWFRHAQYVGEKSLFRNEWRPWQEVGHRTAWHKLNILQRMRLEQRFMQQITGGTKTGQYDQTTRLRYRLEIQVPLKGSAVTTSVINEVMVNPGYWKREKFFDQNRTFIGVNVRVSPSILLQAQYMKIWLQRSGNLLEDQDVVRLNIHQQFNWKK